jgi:hypothetical protein
VFKKAIIDFVSGGWSPGCEPLGIYFLIGDDTEQIDSLWVLLPDSLVENAPFGISLKVNAPQIVQKAVELELYNSLEAEFLIIQFFNVKLHRVIDILGDQLYCIFLCLRQKFRVLGNYLLFDVRGNGEPRSLITRVNGVIALVHLLGDVFTDVKKIACTFVAVCSPKSLLHDKFITDKLSIVVIELPPLIHFSVENVGVVMAILCKAIMDNYCM